ncbi:alcohol oxidase [Penicillium vulpinum]|uniref:Glucose-methanol-choline oxidoreductase N-terminal domain-containing protein n=1 Tax=Penicillium vulpinum TaxID=29845 RepID=A0A1V6R3C5_9EURO|nr:alcohol oxidase [Penicillium vulpinum]KAJ5957962.1 alcohol oxidase [Penicillium vulpinum]OQD95984.1 hypothetical protein PENVUL_c099G03136 [Penicillium vulpinum]
MKLGYILYFCLSAGLAATQSTSRLRSSSFGLAGQNQTFDYVIVGGGLTGLVTAMRLSESGKYSVAVIEAGGFYEVDAGNTSVIPAYESDYLESPPTIDWKIYTTNQAQLGGRSILYSQGKTFGGGTARNGMAYHRSTKGAYQTWADQVDDPSFTFDNLLPYFMKSINFTAPNLTLRGGPQVSYDPKPFSSSGGPLRVSFWNYFIPASDIIAKGLRKLGFKETSQIQSGSLLGFAQYPATLTPDTQVRDSAETSFLVAAIETDSNSNLQLYPNTLAQQILFDSNKTAVGVLVETTGWRYELSARKEVILAAGVFHTPQLLMVSGVGPSETLQRLNISVVSALEGVGQNMMDNPGYGTLQPINATSQHRLWNNATYAAEAYLEFYNSRSGPLTAFGSNYILWEKFPNSSFLDISADTRKYLSTYPSDWPDVEYIFNVAGAATNTSGDYLSVGVVVLKASSRGSVTINTTDMADYPLVDVNWFSTKGDQELGVAGLRRARQFVSASNINAELEEAPGSSVQTDEQILNWIKSVASPSHHAVGTCSMGSSKAKDAVVDSKGLVRGSIQRLRIVDASIMPILTPGQPMGTLYGLAEKLADDILSSA